MTDSDISYIAPEVNVQAALLIRKARAGRPLADLARILDASWPSVDKAAAALNKRMVLSFE